MRSFVIADTESSPPSLEKVAHPVKTNADNAMKSGLKRGFKCGACC
jgi:hypothetical protein